MPHSVPTYLTLTFLFCTVFTLLMLAKAAHWNKRVIVLSILWLAFQAALATSGFYEQTSTKPFYFLTMIPPTLVLIATLFLSKKGRQFIDSLDVKTLTLLHTVRIPVEICLLWLSIQKFIPELMTFEGRNFDIIAGITAPIVYFFYFKTKKLSSNVFIIWNVAMLLLLINIIINALLSVPLPFQQFAFDQPNIAILHYPYVWLPSFIVPAVIFSHLVTIRRVRKKTA